MAGPKVARDPVAPLDAPVRLIHLLGLVVAAGLLACGADAAVTQDASPPAADSRSAGDDASGDTIETADPGTDCDGCVPDGCVDDTCTSSEPTDASCPAPPCDDVALPEPAFDPFTIVPRLPDQSRLEIRPVLFLPSDVARPPAEIDASEALFLDHLLLARDHLASLLGGASLQIADSGVRVYRSPHPNARFTTITDTSPLDAAHLITAELLALDGADRFNSNALYVVAYVRPADAPYNYEFNYFGGGRPFNGLPNSGGGYADIEYATLLVEDLYPFQSTLIHEIGHALGLPHVDCYGRDLYADSSIMSYDPAKNSAGLDLGPSPGDLQAEELFVLGLSRRALPDFVFDPPLHDPTGRIDLVRIQRCFFPRMGDGIGPLIDMLGVGYELFYGDQRVNGPETALWSFDQAMSNCSWNLVAHPQIPVRCAYNGTTFTPKGH